MGSGRYYLKHTINHQVDNRMRIEEANKRFKAAARIEAINYLSDANVSLEEKISYATSLKDLYRYGRKYKYHCGFTNAEIVRILSESGNDINLFPQTLQLQEEKKQNAVLCVISGIIVVILMCLLGWF